MRKRSWMYLSLLCLVISILSLFLSVLSYTNGVGVKHSYNLIDLISDPDSFGRFVSSEYQGELFQSIDLDEESVMIILFAIVGIAALVCAIIGVVRMGRQRPTRGSFILALIGLIGTALPALTILILLGLSRNYFQGSINAGLYVIITPIAMICSVITVSLKHNRNKKQMEARDRVKDYLRLAGDL